MNRDLVFLDIKRVERTRRGRVINDSRAAACSNSSPVTPNGQLIQHSLFSRVSHEFPAAIYEPNGVCSTEPLIPMV